ncbi:MAG: hypothetical protein JW837_18040 [Sedimentisphaerales bacterium]|nr:hypothetical protein [Sedimentisphaerales bacterium]
MKKYKFNEKALFISFIITSILLAGCIVSDTSMRYSGVERSHLIKIKPGITTKEKLLDLIGEPSEQSVIADGVEILKYKCIMNKDEKVVLFPPPLIIDHKKETEHLVVFRIEDGIVQRRWRENIESN